ncbi:galectin-3-binding protein A-like [Osmerus eperlanus]|uniref:galectin-3-binding protein A-like n=1 Tax=Osmerus eperlanus TaxID=29151 RepID=UPI002E13F92E
MQTCVITFPWCLLLLLLHVSGLDSVSLRGSLFTRDRTPLEGDVRLVGGRALSEGRVEIYHSGKWGTVCDDGWDLAEAQVVCRQLQFPAAEAAVSGGTYGEGSGSIWLDDMDCKGTEKSLSSCTFKDWALTDCSHKEDAGVVCETGSNMSSTVHLLDHRHGLSEELGQLFDSGEGCDVDILVRSPTGNRLDNGSLEVEERNICMHRLVLFLFPQFNVTLRARKFTIEVSQSCQTYVTSFIRYLYTRQTEVTVSSAHCLYQLASEFGVTQLMQDVGRLFTVLLPEDSTFHTQVALYKYSVEAGDLVLQENCLQYLSWNFEDLTSSPAWMDLSVNALQALLSRSDMVVPDEAFLLQALESWISERKSSVDLENQNALLGQIRFPMIPAEKLYDLQFTSQLYKSHEKLYGDGVLKGFELNVLLIGKLKKNADFKGEEFDYRPRIYTAEPWSITLNNTKNDGPYRRPMYSQGYYRGYEEFYYPNTAKSFSTPVHSSLVFQNNKISWTADVYLNRQQCPSCESLPAAKLSTQNTINQSTIRYSNRLLILCKEKYVSHVQDFKDNLALVPNNSSSQSLAYPCPDDQYAYRFVVRPEYF